MPNRAHRTARQYGLGVLRWWREQNADTQAATKGLIGSGQIEFVNGGWCMADNASPSTDAQIDQVTLGHRYVHDVFGVTPKFAWAIDPFGLSASFALWFQQMNYTAWVRGALRLFSDQTLLALGGPW